MRIALYHNLPSGGGKRALFELVRRLAERHDVDGFSLSTSEHEYGDIRPFCRRHAVYPFAPTPLMASPFGRLNQGVRTIDLSRLKRLQRTTAQDIDAGAYDVVFVHTCQFAAAPPLLRFIRTPTVYFCQEPARQALEPRLPRPYTEFSRLQRVGNLFDPLPGLYRRTLIANDRAATRSAGTVLVNSHYSRESLYRAYGVLAHVCYLGVDTDFFSPVDEPKAGFVLSVGAVNPSKGFDFLICSLALIDAARRPELVIVSNAQDARERGYLESLGQRQGVTITFRTMVSDEELRSLYSRAQLVLYAPVMEPFGLVPLEAMACGTPIVAVREAGVRETVRDGETGLLCERDPEEYARAVLALLDDERWRAEMGRRSRKHAIENWSWDSAAVRVENHLRAMADRAT